MTAVVVVAAALIAMGTGLGVDYANPSWIGNDAASSSIEALFHFNLHEFAAQQPMMGSFSLFTDPEGRMIGLWKPAIN